MGAGEIAVTSWPGWVTRYAPVVVELPYRWIVRAAIFLVAQVPILLDSRAASADDWVRGLPVHAWGVAASVSGYASSLQLGRSAARTRSATGDPSPGGAPPDDFFDVHRPATCTFRAGGADPIGGSTQEHAGTARSLTGGRPSVPTRFARPRCLSDARRVIDRDRGRLRPIFPRVAGARPADLAGALPSGSQPAGKLARRACIPL